MGAGALVSAGPAVFAALVAGAIVCILASFRPGRSRPERERLDEYAGRRKAPRTEPDDGLVKRIAVPTLRRLFRSLARRMPRERVEATRLRLVQAGNPGGLSAIDFL